MDNPTLKEFYDLLEQHDWSYAWSDDARVYNKGEGNFEKLATIAIKQIAKGNHAYQELLEGFIRHSFSGDAWKTEKHPKPGRPS